MKCLLILLLLLPASVMATDRMPVYAPDVFSFSASSLAVTISPVAYLCSPLTELLYQVSDKVMLKYYVRECVLQLGEGPQKYYDFKPAVSDGRETELLKALEVPE